MFHAAGFRYAFDCGDGGGYGPFGAASSTTCSTLIPGTLTVHGQVKDVDGGVTAYTGTVNVAVTFDGVCAVAQHLASTPSAAQNVCDALAKAKQALAKGNRIQEIAALLQAAAAVVKDAAHGSSRRRRRRRSSG